MKKVVTVVREKKMRYPKAANTFQVFESSRSNFDLLFCNGESEEDDDNEKYLQLGPRFHYVSFLELKKNMDE